jgi:hypothetical protein
MGLMRRIGLISPSYEMNDFYVDEWYCGGGG